MMNDPKTRLPDEVAAIERRGYVVFADESLPEEFRDRFDVGRIPVKAIRHVRQWGVQVDDEYIQMYDTAVKIWLASYDLLLSAKDTGTLLEKWKVDLHRGMLSLVPFPRILAQFMPHPSLNACCDCCVCAADCATPVLERPPALLPAARPRLRPA